jgi:3-oxoacyl-[acyl-carrier-protein] synthase II
LATGCASGLTSLAYATDLVRRGEAEVMFAVSADELTSLLHLGIDRLGLMAPDEVRLYHPNGSGLALGAGGVALVVESAESATARGAPILAEVVGHAITSDGYRIAGNAQDGVAWGESFRRAIADAGLTPDDVGTVYGDARGTPALDLAEARAIAGVWEPGKVRVANLSGQVGHVHSTTPMLAAVCASETVRTGWAPPPVTAEEPRPEIASHLAAGADDDRRASLVTAANWGGTYASVVLRGWEG